MLADLAQVAALLGRALTVDETARAAALGPSIDAAIEAHCARWFESHDIEAAYTPGSDGTVTLWPPDVLTVTTVTDDDGDPVTYTGPVRNVIDVADNPGTVTVAWSAGFDTVPADVVWAASQTMAAELSRQAYAAAIDANGAVKAERVGETSIDYLEPDKNTEWGQSLSIPSGAADLLRRWKLRNRPATTPLATSVPVW